MNLNYTIRKTILILLAIGFYLVLGTSVYAEDIYFAQLNAGSNTGSSCSNAKALSAITWGTGIGNIGPGDTLHLCGTITSTLTIGANGSSGSPITIYFEPSAKFSNETWNASSKIITVSGYSYIVIDGGTNGIIEATNNGTSLRYQNEFNGIGLNNAPNFEIKNLTIRNLYVHEAGDTAGAGAIGVNIDYSGGVSSNSSVHHNTMRNVRFGVFWQVATGGHDGAIYNNTVEYCDSGIKVGSRNTSSSWANMSIYNNKIGSHNMWDDPTNNAFHHNGIHFWHYNPSLSSSTGLKVYGNYTYGNGGTYTTASLFFEGNTTDVLIYNNILSGISRNIYTKMSGVNHIISNNTILGTGYSLNTITGVTVTYKNNIEWGTAGRTGSGITASNNLERVDPKFVSSSDYHLQSSSPAIGVGANMSAYYTTDYAGNVRVTRDIGAYQYNGLAGTVPKSPSNIFIQ